MDTSKIARYLWIGRNDINWYQECQELFVELFGEDQLTLVCQIFAATSINTSLQANITLFRKAYYEISKGLPVGDYLPNIRNQIIQVRAGKSLTGRKINSFAAAMSGNPDSVVVDIWLMRCFNIETKRIIKKRTLVSAPNMFDDGGICTVVGKQANNGPTDRQYTMIENYVRTEARAMGLEPRQMSSMLWAGVRIDQSGNFNTHYKERLRYALTNLFNIL